MNAVRNASGRRTKQQGYALMFVLFLMALVLIGASTAVLSLWTEGQREKEEVMIWRGEQYERAIGLFQKKFGHFPTSIDDLVKEGNGNIRFLREAYKNPMNKEDGAWRFIYVTPAGQLVGSVRYTSLQQMAFLDKQRAMGLAAGPAAESNSTAGPSATVRDDNGGQSDESATSNPSNTTDSSGQVMGGFIIGVAGKENKRSVKVYKGGVTYKQWEFIYNPLEQVQTVGAVSTGPENTSPRKRPVPQPPQQQPQMPQQ